MKPLVGVLPLIGLLSVRGIAPGAESPPGWPEVTLPSPREVDLVLPPEGQGIAGWVVRARSPGDCLMFQLQSADSPYRAPEFKTQPNTLRPHVCRGGQWTIADPVPLPKEIRRGESHRIAVECRGEQVTVFLDGERIHALSNAELRSGTVGFRAAGPAERGFFRRIVLRRL